MDLDPNPGPDPAPNPKISTFVLLFFFKKYISLKYDLTIIKRIQTDPDPKHCFQGTLPIKDCPNTISPNLTRGGLKRPILFYFHGKSPHFVVYFIQNNTKLKHTQTLGHFAQMPPL